MRKRTAARELALQVLYQLDVRGPEILDDIAPFLNKTTQDNDVATFAKDLILGTWEHRISIDQLVSEAAHNWELKRMAIVDRNVLRLATFELMFREDIPPAVVINEAIEMAKKYSTQNSGQFVNGILDNIRLKRDQRTPLKDPSDTPSSTPHGSQITYKQA